MTDQDEFAQRVGQRLRDRADELDAATRSRLNRARQRALTELESKRKLSGSRQWLPVGAAALVAMIAIGLWQGRGPDESPDALAVTFHESVVVEALDFEMLLDEDAFEMIENLEFFVWLPDDELETAG